MRVQAVRRFKFPYAFAYIFRFRGAQNHTVTNAKLRELSRGKYMIINTNSTRFHRQMYDYGVFIRPPKYKYLCPVATKRPAIVESKRKYTRNYYYMIL